MTLPPFDTLPTWSAAALLLALVGAGAALGTLYFRSVWASARLLTVGGRRGRALGLGAARLMLLGSILALASLWGALPIIALAVGILVGRARVMRRVRAAP